MLVRYSLTMCCADFSFNGIAKMTDICRHIAEVHNDVLLMLQVVYQWCQLLELPWKIWIFQDEGEHTLLYLGNF